MINSIVIRGVASYSNDTAQQLTGLKRINCFYGLNGSGKSTIAKYLQQPSALDYRSCLMTPNQSEGIYVYNQRFVKENFWDSKDQPGVFTVNKDNVEAEKAIELAEQKSSELTDELKRIESAADLIKKKKNQRLQNLKTKFG